MSPQITLVSFSAVILLFSYSSGISDHEFTRHFMKVTKDLNPEGKVLVCGVGEGRGVFAMKSVWRLTIKVFI